VFAYLRDEKDYNKRGKLEHLDNSNDSWLLRLPVVGQLGRRAMHVLGGQQAYENVSDQIDETLASQEAALEAIRPAIDDDMWPHQAMIIVQIKAKRLLRHMELEQSDVPARVRELRSLLDNYAGIVSFDELNLPGDNLETLRSRLYQVE
jgi:hypothetical protein